MIPVMRRPLPAELSTTLFSKTATIVASSTRYETARASWRGAGTVRRRLRAELATMCARPAFCMYCHESRGTDVDHYVPIARDPLLTFEWRNHLLACGYCNQQAKNERFLLDSAGHPLLLDPSQDDSADHMTMSTTGEFIDLTARGAETIKTLGLNARRDLVEARHRSWRGVIRVFERAAQEGSLSTDDLEDLRFLPVVDAFHHFAHDVATGRLAKKAVIPAVASFAVGTVDVLRGVFPSCCL